MLNECKHLEKIVFMSAEGWSKFQLFLVQHDGGKYGAFYNHGPSVRKHSGSMLIESLEMLRHF